MTVNTACPRVGLVGLRAAALHPAAAECATQSPLGPCSCRHASRYPYCRVEY